MSRPGQDLPGWTYRCVDVFSDGGLSGNPVAVVHDAEDLDDATMARFAHWTNLSETTFLLPPTPEGAAAGADYRLRIFAPGGELPFAGHPTLGSAHAWREAGGVPRVPGRLVQECGVGLVTVRETGTGGRLAFAAPDLLRSGPPTPAELAAATAALGLDPDAVVEASWIDNGPGWLGLLLADAATVLGLRPDFAAFGDLKLGVVGPYGAAGAGEADVEVRAFCPQYGVPEDPVTGSLNAGLGQWLAGRVLPADYVAAQGTVLGRAGRVHVSRQGDQVWVAGDTWTTLRGVLRLPS
ncbi:PhzF family phenazine biosynthesis protein [Nocardioides sp.]|uniref:PhzF family phenazine biosynthesis protein n=1 Tax=Nocardioides sp. TaxID=35761 RepID=UPI00351608A5